MVHAQKGDHELAIVSLKLAIGKVPQFVFAYNEMGVQYLKLGKLDDADRSISQALKLNPSAHAPNMNRGIVLYQLKRHFEAEPFFRKALELKPNESAGHFLLGRVLAYLGKNEEAEKELLAALSSGNSRSSEGTQRSRRNLSRRRQQREP